jgi:hypothetical protein
MNDIKYGRSLTKSDVYPSLSLGSEILDITLEFLERCEFILKVVTQRTQVSLKQLLSRDQRTLSFFLYNISLR